MQPQIPMQPRVGAASTATVSLDTTGLEARLSEITSQLQILAAATDVASFESIIADLNSQVANLQTQLNNVNTSRQNLRDLLLQIDGLIDEETI